MKPTQHKHILIVAITLLLVAIPNAARGQVEEVTVQVKGLACPFCVNGVEKHLKKVEGVNEVVTNLKKGEARIRYKFGALFNEQSLRDAVEKGGFTAGAVTLAARGVIEKREEFIFTVTDTKLAFTLHPPHPKKKNQTAETTLSASTMATLEKATASQKHVEIVGDVHTHKEAPPALSVTQVKLLRD
ncbi:MAG: heavy-metal-associated domain-containing protein [Candidatus Hydrogenedentes bacterium]|nr:heavy-metal-associated domain-containing protein [Candidatus Hydrogenedentota bacterium]